MRGKIMPDQLTLRVEAHRDYLDDMLRSLGYAQADLLGAGRAGAPALPMACADCGARSDCAAWLDATVADGPRQRAGANRPIGDAVDGWPRFCPNRETVREMLRGVS
jgi:hypothetical protein